MLQRRGLSNAEIADRLASLAQLMSAQKENSCSLSFRNADSTFHTRHSTGRATIAAEYRPRS